MPNWRKPDELLFEIDVKTHHLEYTVKWRYEVQNLIHPAIEKKLPKTVKMFYTQKDKLVHLSAPASFIGLFVNLKFIDRTRFKNVRILKTGVKSSAVFNILVNFVQEKNGLQSQWYSFILSCVSWISINGSTIWPGSGSGAVAQLSIPCLRKTTVVFFFWSCWAQWEAITSYSAWLIILVLILELLTEPCLWHETSWTVCTSDTSQSLTNDTPVKWHAVHIVSNCKLGYMNRL